MLHTLLHTATTCFIHCYTLLPHASYTAVLCMLMHCFIHCFTHCYHMLHTPGLATTFESWYVCIDQNLSFLSWHWTVLPGFCQVKDCYCELWYTAIHCYYASYTCIATMPHIHVLLPCLIYMYCYHASYTCIATMPHIHVLLPCFMQCYICTATILLFYWNDARENILQLWLIFLHHMIPLTT